MRYARKQFLILSRINNLISPDLLNEINQKKKFGKSSKFPIINLLYAICFR